jgi:hypothetical protein
MKKILFVMLLISSQAFARPVSCRIEFFSNPPQIFDGKCDFDTKNPGLKGKPGSFTLNPINNDFIGQLNLDITSTGVANATVFNYRNADYYYNLRRSDRDLSCWGNYQINVCAK